MKSWSVRWRFPPDITAQGIADRIQEIAEAADKAGFVIGGHRSGTLIVRRRNSQTHEPSDYAELFVDSAQ